MLSKFVADILNNCFYYYFSEKIKLGITSDLSARQMIHMKCQAFFVWKKNQNVICCSFDYQFHFKG